MAAYLHRALSGGIGHRRYLKGYDCGPNYIPDRCSTAECGDTQGLYVFVDGMQLTGVKLGISVSSSVCRTAVGCYGPNDVKPADLCKVRTLYRMGHG